mgnify:CR=1 FL=1
MTQVTTAEAFAAGSHGSPVFVWVAEGAQPLVAMLWLADYEEQQVAPQHPASQRRNSAINLRALCLPKISMVLQPTYGQAPNSICQT